MKDLLVHFEGASIRKDKIQIVSPIKCDYESQRAPQDYGFDVGVSGDMIFIRKTGGAWTAQEAAVKREEFLQLIGWL